MSREEDQAIAPRNPQASGSVIVLSAGLYLLALGEAVFLLAALLLPPTAVQNDATFFVYGLLGMACVFIGSLLVASGLIGIKGAHWLVVLGILLVAVFAAYGFRWPDWLLPSIDNPFRPFIGQFTLGGIMLVLFLVVLLSRWQRVWPTLWKPLLIAAATAVVTIALLVWLYSLVP